MHEFVNVKHTVDGYSYNDSSPIVVILEKMLFKIYFDFIILYNSTFLFHSFKLFRSIIISSAVSWCLLSSIPLCCRQAKNSISPRFNQNSHINDY